MSVSCPHCGAVASFGSEIPHHSDCPAEKARAAALKLRLAELEAERDEWKSRANNAAELLELRTSSIRAKTMEDALSAIRDFMPEEAISEAGNIIRETCLDLIEIVGELNWPPSAPKRQRRGDVTECHCPVCGCIHEPGCTQLAAAELSRLTVSPLPEEIAELIERAEARAVARWGSANDSDHKNCLEWELAAALRALAQQVERLKEIADATDGEAAKIAGENSRLRARIAELEAEVVRLTDPPNPPITMNDALALLAAQGREIKRLQGIVEL